jgi:hypothetical protein
MEAESKRISLPDEEPEIFSSVLEYLYKGDYYPRLIHNKRKNTWEIEAADDGGRGAVESTVYHHGVDGELLKDTVIYCTAEKYGLDELKRVALRKQGLRKFLLFTHLPPHESPATNGQPSQNRASNAARSSHLPDTHTPTHLTATQSFVHTISHSSSVVGAPSSAAVPCSLRCRPEGANCSSISLSLYAITLMT